MEKLKVLFVGESWFFTKVESKGFDQFSSSGYETEIGRVREYMKDLRRSRIFQRIWSRLSSRTRSRGCSNMTR